MRQLSQSQVSGAFPITSLTVPTPVVRMPAGACGPAVLTVVNLHASATIYLKWVASSGSSGGSVLATTDCPIRLAPGAAYTWDSPPRNAVLLAVSTVAGALLGVDGNWSVGGEVEAAV